MAEINERYARRVGTVMSDTDHRPSGISPASVAPQQTQLHQTPLIDGDQPEAPSTGLEQLMRLEAAIRDAKTIEQLHLIAANEPRKICGADQIIVFTALPKLQIAAISGLSKVDRSVPYVRKIEKYILQLAEDGSHTEPIKIDLSSHNSRQAQIAAGIDKYLFPNLVWMPFPARKGKRMGGMLLTKTTPWSDTSLPVIDRIANTLSHAAALLTIESQPTMITGFNYLSTKWVAIVSALAAMAGMAIPVSMSALAPFEVIAKEPFIVSAGIAGVIEQILVEPGQTVSKNQTIVRFSDTVQRTRLEIAEREVQVTQAKVRKANILSFDSQEGRGDLRLAIADLALNQSDLKLARGLLSQTTITAKKTGLAVFSDRQMLIGKPVIIGERIMQIADPEKIEIQIHLAIENSILLKNGARVKLILDSDPLNSRESTIHTIDNHATKTPAGNLAFSIFAELSNADLDLPHIGVRGTAQVYGETVPLGLYIFRRPLSTMRQWLGI